MESADLEIHKKFLAEAIAEARIGLAEGGLPIGSVLVKNGRVIGSGHNKRMQEGSPILHAEMDCLANAGRLLASDYKNSTLYSTLSPCDMCSGAVLLYKIPRVVIGENLTFKGPESYLKSNGVELINLNSSECQRLMQDFINKNPEVWQEDIGK